MEVADGVVGTPLQSPIVVQLFDRDGNVARGWVVNFAVPAGALDALYINGYTESSLGPNVRNDFLLKIPATGRYHRDRRTEASLRIRQDGGPGTGALDEGPGDNARLQ
jgi:hypothetical protein